MKFLCLGLATALCLAAPSRAQKNTPKQPDTRTTPAPNEKENLSEGTVVVTPDYPLATWVPANPRNFQRADRPAERPIDMVLIHDIEGSAEACLSWFQNERARATSHYVVDSVTGKVYQMVKEHDIAWHAGNRDINSRSVGIENGGYAYRPGFFNPVEYEGLAKLVRDITTRYSIPRDREHIIGHNEVPNPSRPGSFGGSSGHTDPGPYWDWNSFMTLVRENGRLDSSDFPSVIHPGQLIPVTVKYTNTGDDLWKNNNKGAEDPDVAAKGAMYLGTWAPFMHTSPFFSFKYMTSPSMLSSITNGDVPAGGQAIFKFSMLGPRRYGNVTEHYRVTHFPAAPNTPTAFGDTLTAHVKVVPWNLEFAAADAGFKGAGWNVKGKTLWRKAGAGDSFVWKPALPIDGKWDVYVRWPAAPGRVRDAKYVLTGQKQPVSAVIDQRTGKGKWLRLGRFAIDNPRALTVELSTESTRGTVVADALKFVGPFE